MDTCQKTIQQFLDRDLEHWAGLAEGCEESQLENWLEFRPGEGITHRGAEFVTYRFRSLAQPGRGEGVFFYFEKDRLSFIATDDWPLDRDESVELRRRLGEPANRLDLHWSNMILDDAELVYSDRGLSLGVIPETELFAMVMVFPPCTLDIYLAKYRHITPAREFE
jgi:hypothetical protein